MQPDTSSRSPNQQPAAPTGPPAHGACPTWVEETWVGTVKKLDRTSRRIGATFPHVSRRGRYDDAAPSWWTNGFWPGTLWLVHRDTGDERLAALAIACEERLDQALHDYHGLHHDVGFMWGPTSVARHKLTGNQDSRRRALIAASHLAARFNLRGRFIRAWNGDKTGWAIIDCLMNLPLLYWAARELDDPRHTFIAEAHADTVLRHFLRPDGSSRHIVSFNPQTGDFIEALGGQGHAPESAWSRGNAWALYGLAVMYRNSGESRFLEAARRVARFFVDHLPGDHVPYWDFSVPVEANTPRDSSAGAIAASGLLELARHVASTEASTWREAAIEIIRSLDANYGAWDADEEGLIVEGTGHVPAGQNVRVPLIYGDYYFVEALAKLRGRDSLFW